MKKLKLKKVVKKMGGEIVWGSKEAKIRHVSYFPRSFRKHTLYFDMPHPYSKRSLGSLKGKPSIIVSSSPHRFEKLFDKNTTVIKVKNSIRAYWDFVRYYRTRFKIPVIGVTGTCGKTTTTEMIKTILAKRYRVHGTVDGKNNLNNNLPYLLGFNEQTEAAVFEMGVSHPGCVADSCRHFRPQVGIILNIGVYHLLGCKTFDQYVRAKAEMIAGIEPGGTLILNADDKHVRSLDVSSFKGQIVTFGVGENADFRATDIRYIEGGMAFTLHAAGQSLPLIVHGYGEENVYNAIAALAAAHAIGMNLKEAGAGLAKFEQVRQHLEKRQGPNGSEIIDDTWNCTPPSVHASLKVLDALAGARRKVALLGYMPQLGTEGQREYDKIAQRVMEVGVDHLIVIGEANRIGQRVTELGMDPNRIDYCRSGHEVAQALTPFLNDQHLILYKFPYKYRLAAFAPFRQLMKETLGYS
ncbi:hypothetical protein BEP19_09425 [Ammoniphilus oxalaticus]|uniref:UDP-N-acetylmuramoyl-tripeptide--D-alanyl-D-alanine ligase n=1 Tax=Ammoniphilus oxalaticus TaxID=66863 RepID=A0A419SKQ0_9BACL|nr:Mur ligase family protein [Ammoniphilus oxalaticus]RKD24587.1 hypothetical protein BEP19_09425 [Ammoniphilus oxalaticus]